MFTLLFAIYCKVKDWLEKWFITAVIGVLKSGKVPHHVAFIMDGNRRYATKRGLGDRRLGHYHGYGRLEQVLDWCFRLGIKCITVYAFSVENFKRTKEEVSTLMDMAVEKLAVLAMHSDLIKNNRVGIRIIGELDLLPENVRLVALKAMSATAHYDNFILNICFPYVSRMEMQRARKAYDNLISDPSFAMYPEESLYRSCLDTFDCPDIDIMVRTSGECRLSEFMLHQLCVSPRCYYTFTNLMWPEFSLFEFGKVLLKYQVSLGRVKYDQPIEEIPIIPAVLKARRQQELIDICGACKDDIQDAIGR